MIKVTTEIRFREAEFRQQLNTEAAKRLNKAAALLHRKMIDNISRATRIHGASLPHQFPHADTGRLRQSLTIDPATPTKLVASIRSNLVYAKYLELGTKRMQPRTFARRTLNELRSQIQTIFGNG